jgi:hypothetical protein
MSDMTIEMLTTERVTELWPVLEPYFVAACNGNPIAKDELDAKDIYVLAVTGMVAVFVGFEDGQPACVLGVQFSTVNGHKSADVMALAGRSLMKFRAAYWRSIIEWLKANDVEFLDAYAPERLAKLYMKRFGFNKSCVYVRMNLQGDSHE